MVETALCADPVTAPKHRSTPRWRLRYRYLRRLIARRVPPGARLALGLLLMAMGVVGFLPVVGFWMLPLGAAIAMMDLRPIWRWMRRLFSKHSG